MTDAKFKFEPTDEWMDAVRDRMNQPKEISLEEFEVFLKWLDTGRKPDEKGQGNLVEALGPYA